MGTSAVALEDLLMQPPAEGARYLMQMQQYAWAGDQHLAMEVLRLKEKHRLENFVETGTYLGTTTLWAAKHFRQVLTAEINPQFSRIAEKRFATIPNILQYHRDSLHMLENVHEHCADYMAFLDAHWEQHCPLLDELAAIAKSPVKPSVLVLHDMFNPNHPEYQFDTYNGQRFELNWVGPSLDAIYGVGGWDSHWNDEAEGVRVGVLFIEKA